MITSDTNHLTSYEPTSSYLFNQRRARPTFISRGLRELSTTYGPSVGSLNLGSVAYDCLLFIHMVICVLLRPALTVWIDGRASSDRMVWLAAVQCTQARSYDIRVDPRTGRRGKRPFRAVLAGRKSSGDGVVLYSHVSSCSWLYSMLAHLRFTASVVGIPRAKIGRTLIGTKRAMSCSMTAFLLGTTFTGQYQAALRSRHMLWPCMCGTHEGAMQYRTSIHVHCHQDVALSCGRFSCRCLHSTSLTPRVGPHDMTSFSMFM